MGIYNALLPVLFAPINFICAVSFIQFYRSYMNQDNEDDNGRNNGNGNGNANNENDESGKEIKINIENNKLGISEYMFSIKRHWLGIQPSTICLRIGVDNDAIYKVFESTAC